MQTEGTAGPHRQRSGSRLAGLLMVLLTACAVVVVGLKKPDNNWDEIGYVAVALSAEGHRGADLNEATYGSLRDAVDAATFAQLIQGDYRATVFRDPVSLQQQLPFYSIRVLYMQSLRLVHALGFDYPRATHIVSASFAALSVLLLALLAGRLGAPIWALPFVAVAGGLFDVARLSTPDAMACFFSLWAIHALLRNSAIVFVVAALLPLVRTDMLILSLLVLAYTFVNGRKAVSVASALAALALYLYATVSNGSYGWLTLFNMSLIHKTPYPATLVPSHTLVDYVRPYFSTAYGFAGQPQFVIFGLALAWLLLRKAHGTVDQAGALIVICLGFVALHLLLFPSDTYRYFAAEAMVSLTVLMAAARAWHQPSGDELARIADTGNAGG
ncbi:hypothetical protein ACXU4B_04745 [Dyella soli]|uniref:Glycosyltransferase RgtA/B/C/D-like domain-containing protein n=1 Tax=Dyella soli TaxID=522319 RepID=A0A4R0YXS7_9GAMM|nr:hypothetical protein [Dyella soli]TCI10324.1 hypothetical protein EZM97_15630 [Dyella soli]